MKLPHLFYIIFLTLLCLVCDAIRLIVENGYRPNSHFYHLGDGGHAYHYNLETASSIYFKCVMYHELRCPGRAILRVGGTFRESKPHNHPPDPDFVGARHFRQNVLAECERRFVDFHDVLDQARRDRRYSRTVRSRMTMRRLRNPMYRARMSRYPPIPQTLRELSRLLLQDRWKGITGTIDEEDNLYAGSTTASDGSHHVLFISQRMLQFMSNIKIVQSDGTFRARPNVLPSSQCFVFVTPWRNTVIPLGWALMERRTLSAYRALFGLLKQVCPNFSPDTIITDWEYSQQKAWQEHFPNAQIQGCLWHLCRSYVKKAKQLRLFRFKAALPDVFHFIRRACAIALLPKRFFRVGLGVLKTEAFQTDILVAYLLEPFFQYVEQKWINNISRRNWMSLFLSMHRTNNCCESHNKMLRKKVGAYRPNVFKFIDALAYLEHKASLDIMLLRNGGNPSRTRRWQSVYADRQLAALSEDLQNDVFRNMNESVKNFLHRASHLFRTAYDYHILHEGGH